MTAMTYRARDKLVDKAFAEPGKRAYPITDKAHAADAKARASEAANKGSISKSNEGAIDRKANEKLYGSAKAPAGRK